MKIGVISDIHGNLEALTEVLKVLEAEGCGKILCTGDLVGYGPYPQECIELLREKKIPCVLGNHDEWVSQTCVLLGMRPVMKVVMAWTRQVLSRETLFWLSQLPRTMTYANLEVVHASCVPHVHWPYVRDPKSLAKNIKHQKSPVCFLGHTHVPAFGIWREGEPAHFALMQERMQIPQGHRATINPGSVGQPRDGDPRAACLIYDTRDRSAHFIRVEYDFTKTQEAMRKFDLPDIFIERLAFGR